MSTGGDGSSYLCQVQVHRHNIAVWQHEAGAFTQFGADRPEDVCRCRALILRSRGPCTPPSPSPRDLVFLANSGFIGKPDFYGGRIDVLLTGDFVQEGWEIFLKISTAPAAWA